MAVEGTRNTALAAESEYLAVCPECGAQVPVADRDAHVANVHGYVEVAGQWLPHADALAQLWEQVFRAADSKAHQRLTELLAGEFSEEGESPYRAALEMELSRRADAIFAARWLEVPRLVQCLRRNPEARPHFRGLLRASDPRVRDLGRELLTPEACEQLADPKTTPEHVARWIRRLCPVEGLEEKIRLCQRLPQFGANAAAVAGCLEELRSERPVACPECWESVPGHQLDAHLQQAHQIYAFRGARRKFKEALGMVLAAVCSAEPDVDAWRMLQGMARDAHGAHAETFLAQWLGEALRDVQPANRGEVITALAQTAAVSGCSLRLLTLLTAGPSEASRQLALAVVARLPLPIPSSLISAVRPLLMDTRLPEGTHIGAAAALVHTLGQDNAETNEVLGALVAGLPKVKAVERLRRLQEHFGPAPTIEQFRSRIEDLIRMRCPRCPVEMRRREMVQHLWTEHTLILDGRRAREPWALIEDWIDKFRRKGDAELLTRCRALAQRLDAENGLQRVHRLFMKRGVADNEACAALLSEAQKNRTSLCPHCFAFVPLPREVPPFVICLSHGRLTARGYRVEIVEGGLVPRVEMETPDLTLPTARDEGRGLTIRGAIYLWVGPFVIAALLLAVALPAFEVRPLVSVVALLAWSLAVYGGVRLLYRPRRDLSEHVVDYAWTHFVPHFHEKRFSLEESGFVSGLAVISRGRGDPAERSAALERVLAITEKAVTRGAVHHLAVLRRLQAEDQMRAGTDALAGLVAQVGRCFDGKLPLAYADALLADLDAKLWSPGVKARLRVLLCDRAFEAGFELRNLVEAGETAPALGKVLDIADQESLAWLRLLWSLRPRKPWDRCGPATNVFDLAANPEEGERLAKWVDLLLVPTVRLTNRGRGGSAGQSINVEFLVSSRGIVFRDRLFTRLPSNIEIVSLKTLTRDGYQLVLDGHTFDFAIDPEPIANKLERWSRFLTAELTPLLADVDQWQSPNVTANLRAHDMVRCPECRQTLMSRAGEVGMPVEKLKGK
jgi:hypothetical protein